MPVERLHTPEQLVVVPAVDQDLQPTPRQTELGRCPPGAHGTQGALHTRERAATCEFVFTLVVSTLRGPVRNSSSSFFSKSSTDMGAACAIAAE